MRTYTEIKNSITQSFITNTNIIDRYNLTAGLSFEAQFSLLSIENILFSVIAGVIYTLEQFFGQHKIEVTDQLYNQKSGRLPWYRFMALKFLYGFELLPDSDEFDLLGATAQQIAVAKIIKYSAVNNSDIPGQIVIKIATENEAILSPVTAQQKEAVEAYFERIKWAGTYVTIINYLPDRLFLNIKIQRDPLVIDENGNSILNGGKPVEDAIQSFLKELPFNGELVLAHLIDKLQLVDGVVIPTLLEASSSWIDATIDDYGIPTVIDIKRIPVSGYFEVTNFNSIEYVV